MSMDPMTPEEFMEYANQDLARVVCAVLEQLPKGEMIRSVDVRQMEGRLSLANGMGMMQLGLDNSRGVGDADEDADRAPAALVQPQM